MKKITALFSGMIALVAVNAQTVKEADVPAAVKSAFNTKYPNTKVEKWEKEGANFEAEFHANKVETCAVFDGAGTFLESEIEIKTSALPKSVSDYVTKNMPGKKIKEASKITTAGGKVSYEAEIDDAYYMFDDQGNFIGKETETDKKDDKD